MGFLKIGIKRAFQRQPDWSDSVQGPLDAYRLTVMNFLVS